MLYYGEGVKVRTLHPIPGRWRQAGVGGVQRRAVLEVGARRWTRGTWSSGWLTVDDQLQWRQPSYPLIAVTNIVSPVVSLESGR